MPQEFSRRPPSEKIKSADRTPLLTPEQKKHFEKLIFEFEKKLRFNLTASEGGEGGREVPAEKKVPNERFAWGMYATYVGDVLKSTIPKDAHNAFNLEPKTLTAALAAYEALPENPDDRAMILEQFKNGNTSGSWDRSLIALSVLSSWEQTIAEKTPQIIAAKSAAFHDWHDTIDFDNLKLPREDDPSDPQPDELFKYTELVQETVEKCIAKGLEIPLLSNGKLDLERLMYRAYQEKLIPKETYIKHFQKDMQEYFIDEAKKRRNKIKQQN